MGSIPGSGRFPAEGNGYPLQYSCLENSLDRGAWWPIVHSSILAWSSLWRGTWCATMELQPAGYNWVTNSFIVRGFPHSSAGKESACNAGDLGSIPGSGRPTGKGTGSPLQYSWASLVAQLVKNLPAMWETWVWSLGWEDPLAKEKATHSSILAWKIPWSV